MFVLSYYYGTTQYTKCKKKKPFLGNLYELGNLAKEVRAALASSNVRLPFSIS
jgi:hypothetical protein